MASGRPFRAVGFVPLVGLNKELKKCVLGVVLGVSFWSEFVFPFARNRLPSEVPKRNGRSPDIRPGLTGV